jgi:DNA-binding NarL/FixJ family response regulator
VRMDQEKPRPGGAPSRIVLADDHPLVRDALKRMLDTQPDLEVVGEASDGQEAVELCRSLQPDLVMMDVMMPRMDGLAATRQVKQEFPCTIVLVLTASDWPYDLSEALKAGAAGYVLKLAPIAETIDAVRKVVAGESPLNQGVATRLLMELVEERPKEGVTLEESSVSEGLTPREVDVLRLMAQGRTNRQIARELLISVSTVKKHAASVISKLGVSDRTQAAVRAVELGMLSECEGG